MMTTNLRSARPLGWAVALAFAGPACGGGARAAPREPAVDHVDLQIGEVSEYDDGVLLVTWRPTVPGQRFVLVSERGVEGVLETSAEPPPDCDDCDGVRARATVREGRAPTFAAAVGPVDPATVRSAIVLSAPRTTALTDLEDAWRTNMVVDLDGDGAADLTQVERCGHWNTTGCESQICDTRCTATRFGDGQPTGEVCARYVIDLEDCEPGE